MLRWILVRPWPPLTLAFVAAAMITAFFSETNATAKPCNPALDLLLYPRRINIGYLIGNKASLNGNR